MKSARPDRSTADYLPRVTLQSLKAHHHVPLEQFDAWVRLFERAGGAVASRRSDMSAYGLAICDFGAFDLIGHAGGVPDGLLAVRMTAEVTGLQTLAEALPSRGHCIVLEPHAVESGSRMLARDSRGDLIEYLERP